MTRLLALLSALLVCLGGCATYTQPPISPPPGFAGPAAEDRFLVMDDGARLPLTRWSPREKPWAVIVALHGMNDYRASFRLAGPWWAERGIETWAYDQRGFGQAPGRGVWAGQERMVRDLRTAVDLARRAHPDALIVIAGESMGGSVATAAAASDDPPVADRVVLLAPGVWGWSSQPPFNTLSLWIAARVFGDTAVEPPAFITRRILASDNLLELVRNGRDPAFIISTRFDTLAGLIGLMEAASDRLGVVKLPTLMMYGDSDQIIEKGPTRRALRRAGAAPNLRTAWYPGHHHLLNRDLEAEVVFRDVEAWLRDRDAPLPSGAGPVLPALETSPRPRRGPSGR